MSRPILVPLDFSLCSARIVQAALDRAATHGSRLLFLHVLAPPSEDPWVEPEPGHIVRLGEHRLGEALSMLEGFVAQAERAGLEAEARVETGDAADIIVRLARRAEVATVVMGAHQRHGLARVVFGSVSERVAREAHTEVVLVPGEHGPECEAGSCNWCTDAGLFHRDPDLPRAL